jgi:hypothetical protein
MGIVEDKNSSSLGRVPQPKSKNELTFLKKGKMVLTIISAEFFDSIVL